jgi:hypothetical protein
MLLNRVAGPLLPPPPGYGIRIFPEPGKFLICCLYDTASMLYWATALPLKPRKQQEKD